MIIFSKVLNTIRSVKALHYCLIMFVGGLLVSCTTMKVNVSNNLVMPAQARIAVGPFANHSTTPLANRQVESMLTGLLQAKGFQNVVHFQSPKSCAKLLYCPDETLSNSKVINWARSHQIAYVFVGAVNEWRYKVGLDGEPVAGTSLVLINVNTGKTVWTAVGSVIGGSRSGLDVVGQTLLNNQLASIGAA